MFSDYFINLYATLSHDNTMEKITKLISIIKESNNYNFIVLYPQANNNCYNNSDNLNKIKLSPLCFWRYDFGAQDVVV